MPSEGSFLEGTTGGGGDFIRMWKDLFSGSAFKKGNIKHNNYHVIGMHVITYMKDEVNSIESDLFLVAFKYMKLHI